MNTHLYKIDLNFYSTAQKSFANIQASDLCKDAALLSGNWLYWLHPWQRVSTPHLTTTKKVCLKYDNILHSVMRPHFGSSRECGVKPSLLLLPGPHCSKAVLCIYPTLLLWAALGWFGFMAYQPLYVIKYQIHFYTYKQIYFKQFSWA